MRALQDLKSRIASAININNFSHDVANNPTSSIEDMKKVVFEDSLKPVSISNKKPIRPSKILRALLLLVDRSLIQPEAYSLYRETCLHSTISTLANKYNLVFTRKPELYGEYKTRFIRYQLEHDSRDAAIKLLEKLIQEYKAKLNRTIN